MTVTHQKNDNFYVMTVVTTTGTTTTTSAITNLPLLCEYAYIDLPTDPNLLSSTISVYPSLIFFPFSSSTHHTTTRN